MRVYLDCLPCLLRQALEAARAATEDENIHRRVINSVAAMIPQLSSDLRPPEIAQQGYQLIYQITGNSDPFRQVKVESNREALALYPRLKEVVSNSEAPLLTACKLAIIGNSIDLAPNFDYGGINNIVGTALASPLVINDYQQFVHNINNSRHILYLGDNAGEIVFDRVLIEELRQIKELEIDFVVRERPIINDATMEDAMAVGMDRVARIVSSGCDAPATILSQCSSELLRLYYSADVIIAKGQGNYESLDEEPDNIFFLLRAKCQIVARLLRVNVGDAILQRHRG
ncbi:MAG TPA: DUF89 family protein [Dehalococcoidia bacterium]|nr:DUF89 family protein [Dehalococcoidia bacterium]